VTASAARPLLRSERTITERATRILDKHKMRKHFDTTTGPGLFTFQRLEDNIAKEARLAGFQVVRTNVEPEVLDADRTVETQKQLSRVERAFRSIKTVLPPGATQPPPTPRITLSFPWFPVRPLRNFGL